MKVRFNDAMSNSHLGGQMPKLNIMSLSEPLELGKQCHAQMHSQYSQTHSCHALIQCMF